MPHHTATPSRRSRTKLRMRRCHRAESPIVQALNYEFDAANRLAAMTVGAVDTSPTTRYVHNALGLRLFKTEPQFPPAAGDENDPAFMASLIAFFTNLWGGNTGAANPSASEKLGFQYFYDEDGSLLYELGSGGANSTGSAHYVYLPTPSGPMPVAFYNGSKHYAVQTDHLNTPRRLTQSDKKVAWQWAFSAFGDEQPTTGKNRYVDPATTPNAGSTTVADVTFNLRYPGQYFDKESGLSYNYFRSYDSRTGRYSQSDPIDLAGGWNRFTYVENDPMSFTDPMGLWTYDPNDVRGGFDSDGRSRVFNPKYYDPSAASKVLILTAFNLATMPVGGACRAATALQTTIHGAERIAGAGATRGGVLSAENILATRLGGRVMTQADGATVNVLQNASGRYNVVVSGDRGIITTFENLSQKSLDRLTRNYGWK
jgi:RHS repeat-associated protein